MAITSITITQDNKAGSVNLLSVHNPLAFTIDVVYTAQAPETLYVQVKDKDDTVLGTFAAIPYKDSESSSIRTFVFRADKILRSFMDDFEDFESPEKTLEYVPNITKEFSIRFYIGIKQAETSLVACHSARQYGENPAMESIYGNADETYYGGALRPVYVYFYNPDPGNVLSIDTPTPDFDELIDYDDKIFVDNDNQYFKSL